MMFDGNDGNDDSNDSDGKDMTYDIDIQYDVLACHRSPCGLEVNRQILIALASVEAHGTSQIPATILIASPPPPQKQWMAGYCEKQGERGKIQFKH